MWRSHAVLTPPARGRLKPGGGGPGGARGGPGRDGGAGHHERGAAARCGRRSPGAEIWRHGAPRHGTGCGGQLPACTAWAHSAGTTTSRTLHRGVGKKSFQHRMTEPILCIEWRSIHSLTTITRVALSVIT